MQPAFERIGAIPGVLGVFTAVSGQVRASSLPAIFTSEMLDQIAEPVLGALGKASALSVDIREVSLTFGDTRAIVRQLTSDCLLVVICQESTDSGRLTDLFTRLEPEFPAIAAYTEEPELQAAGLGLVRPQGPDVPARETPSPAESDPGSAMTAHDSPDGVPDGDPEDGTKACDAEGASASQEEPGASSAQETIGARAEKKAVSEQVAEPGERTVKAKIFVPTADLKLRIREALAEYVGPVAALLVNSALKSGAPSLEALLDQLAREIEAEKDRRDFQAKAGGRPDKA